MAVIREMTADQIEKRQVEFVISTESVDSYGTVFKMAGWKLERYTQNPIVCYAHKSYGDNPDTIIGTSEVFVENNQLIGRITFEPESINPLAEKIFRKVQHGTLRMASIGANPIRGHWGDEKLGEDKDIIYFDEQELIEWSIVPLGSNPEAQKRNAETLEEIRDKLVKDITVNEPVEKRKLTVKEAQVLLNQIK